MALPSTFKAWTYTTCDGKLEDNLQLTEVATPQKLLNPKGSKVVVEVLASALNPADYKIPESPIESRVVGVKKPASPGLDFCGRLVAQPDKIVYGRLAWPDQYGTLGQYILVSENDFAVVPEGVDILQAAASPITALTAYQSLIPFAKEGDRVLCNGGSGGVGTFTIQIAKLLGCHVVATCSAKNVQLCKELGADDVVDYQQGDIVEQLARKEAFDLLVDNVGGDPTLHNRSGAILKPGGRFVLVSSMLGSFIGFCSMAESILRPRWLGGANSRFSLVLCQPNKEQLQQIAEWIKEKRLKVIIDEVFEFGEAVEAMAKLRTGRSRGKIVIKGASQSK